METHGITSKGRDGSTLYFFEDIPSLRQDPLLSEIYRKGKGLGTELHLVGGAIRDFLLGSEVFDYDFVMEGDTEGLSRAIASSLGGSFFLLDRASGSYRVVSKRDRKSFTIDISPLRGRDIVEDLMGRDFTINALALNMDDLFTKERPMIVDPTGGIDDLKAGILRVVSDHAFRDDPLRCIRAVRLLQEYGLRISDRTERILIRDGELLRGVAPERIKEELLNIFTAHHTSRAMERLYRYGLIATFAPELTAWRNGGYDLLSHSLKTLERMECIVEDIKEGRFLNTLPGVGEYLRGTVSGVERWVLLKLTAFVHDAGKALTMKMEDGVLSFIGHDREGARLVEEILMRLTFGRRISGEVSNLVRNHHRVFVLASLQNPSRRARAHFFRATGDGGGMGLLLLALADARATIDGEDKRLFGIVMDMMDFYFSVYMKKERRPLLDGHEIMRVFRIPQGRLVGEIMEKISEGEERGVIKDRDDAIAYIKRWLLEEKGREG